MEFDMQVHQRGLLPVVQVCRLKMCPVCAFENDMYFSGNGCSERILYVCRWVYYEMGTMCHVKAVEGTRRDNVTDLIKV